MARRDATRRSMSTTTVSIAGGCHTGINIPRHRSQQIGSLDGSVDVMAESARAVFID
jgi:hypothetical protein